MKKLALLFGMSERERKGFLVLSVLMVLIGISPFIYALYRKDGEAEAVKLAILVAAETHHIPVSDNDSDPTVHRRVEQAEPFAFDPNGLPAERWKALGFTDRQVQVIKNYETKGGRFRVKSDVAKLYVVSEADYQRLAPYITLPETMPKRKHVIDEPDRSIPDRSTEVADMPAAPRAETPRNKMLKIDVALADTAAWRQIHGIGSVLANRIVKFRDALGGFHSLEQLREVYGISEEQFVKMQPLLLLERHSHQKWPINQLSIEGLAEHPYISFKEARHIVRYREQHGPFSSMADLEALHALNEEFLRKIAPYLEFSGQ